MKFVSSSMVVGVNSCVIGSLGVHGLLRGLNLF